MRSLFPKQDFKIRGYTVGQAPNLPLIIVVGASVVGRITAAGSAINRFSDAVFFAGLSVWSYLETFEGVNAFRRALGLMGFIFCLTLLTDRL